MAKQKSTPGQYGSQSLTRLIKSQEEEPNTDGERNSNNPEQNQDTAGTLQRCADGLHKKHQCNRCCDIPFRLIGGLGNVLVIVAFGLLFNKEHFKDSDYVAIGGAAVSFLANIGKLLVDYKRRYDNRRCIKNKVLPVVSVGKDVFKEITLMLLQPEDSALSRLNCRSECCPCPCEGARCQCCSSFTFLPTFELFESIYNSVSSGWVLSSNFKAISGRIPTNASSKYFQDLTDWNKFLESIDFSFAIFSLVLSLVIIVCALCKSCQGTYEGRVQQIRHLSEIIGQQS